MESNLTSKTEDSEYNNLNCITNRNSSIISVSLFIEGITLCISNDGNVYSLGRSTWGSHGHSENDIDMPKKINNLKNIKMISSNVFCSICLDYDGNVFTFGSNKEGQLGINKTFEELKYTHIPQKVILPPCKQVCRMDKISFCLTEDGNLYYFGRKINSYFSLEDNNFVFESPKLIIDRNNIEYIVCGKYHIICKTYNNEYYSCGSNNHGQLGLLKSEYGEDIYNFTQCLNWPNDIISIKCGNFHSLLLTSKGYVYSFGDNSYGQLGLGDVNIKTTGIPTLILSIPEMKRIECGYWHSMCIDVNDNLWAFGNNDYGQLGLRDTKNRYKPILHPTLSNIIDISSGGEQAFVKTQDNKIYAFGNNEYSQLGIKTSEDYQLTPIQTFIGKEDIWRSSICKNKQKSARK